MKKILLSTVLLSMTISAAWAEGTVNEPVMKAAAVMKALPIYSNNLIDEAPAGKTITGIRDCWSCYYQYGDSYRDFEQGVVGEYVEGDDGNIYLRAACYSAAQISKQTDTYLKLDKVDDTTYVAHTPQLIWVDELDYGTPFTAYATRLVFTQKSATSFTYELQQTSDDTYDTDVYFTLKDGKLSQANMNTFEMNDEIFPEEIIGFTNSTGSWLGFGDGCLTIYKPEMAPTSLPEGAEVKEMSLDYNILHVRDIVIDNAVLVKYAEVGDDLYLSNPSSKSEQWIKGSIDRAAGTVSFAPQYLGIDEESGYAVWLAPVEYDKYVEIFDEETGYGDWFRRYSRMDNLVFDYNNGLLKSTQPNTAIFFSHSPEELLSTGVFAEPGIASYENASLVPVPVKFTKFEPMDDLWGFGVIGFGIPAMSVDGIYIDPAELYYNVFVDDSTVPFEFTPDDYYDMEIDGMTDVPYSYYEDFDFKVNGVNHTVYFYHDWKKVGVQVIQKHDDVETRSEIVYVDENGTVSVGTVAEDMNETARVCRYIKDGRIVIERDGVKYNTLGVRVE